MVKRKRLLKLIRKYLEGKASNKEKEFIEKYYQYFDLKDSPSCSFSEMEKQEMESKMLQNIHAEMQQTSYKPLVWNYKKICVRIAAAAMLAIFIAGITFLYTYTYKKDTPKVTNSMQLHDIAPGGNKATLILANGTKITLDSTKKGIISIQGNTKIIKQNSGLLTYNKSHTSHSKILFNTITTPKGGQYQVVLSDGTKVWLNAASSIHFPNEFTGETREIRVTGEAYFEVTDNAKMPFKVLVNDMTVQVLGTHFNVKAYKDEPVAKITLLEGAVKVTEGNKNLLLEPGQQAQVSREGQLTKVRSVDLQGIIAWKNNQFWFNDDSIQTVMRELSRWYDMDVVIKGNIPQHFGGYISKNIYVSKVFEALQATSHLQYKIQNNTIIVSP